MALRSLTFDLIACSDSQLFVIAADPALAAIVNGTAFVYWTRSSLLRLPPGTGGSVTLKSHAKFRR